MVSQSSKHSFSDSYSRLRSLHKESIFPPEHVVMIMDGNRRWASLRGLPKWMGHYEGVKTAKKMIELSLLNGIHTLTLYTLSTENWQRSKIEIDHLLNILDISLQEYESLLVQEGIQLHTIGDLSPLPKNLRNTIEQLENTTRLGKNMNLVLAINYGGRDEMRRAILKMAKDVENGQLEWKDLEEKTISSYLDTHAWSDPDLVIRSGGQHRLSNCLMWQVSYSELYLSDVLWPDFSEEMFHDAIKNYSNRKKRYGG